VENGELRVKNRTQYYYMKLLESHSKDILGLEKELAKTSIPEHPHEPSWLIPVGVKAIGPHGLKLSPF